MPFTQDKYVTVNDLNLHYRDWEGAGQPMVMLHGLASNNHIWDFVIPHLSHGYHVLAVDQRGHGLTNYPGHDYSFTAVTQDLHAFLLALGIKRPVLVGHSWGGSVVLHYAALYPDYVAALVLVDGGFEDLPQAHGVTWEETRKALAPRLVAKWRRRLHPARLSRSICVNTSMMNSSHRAQKTLLPRDARLLGNYWIYSSNMRPTTPICSIAGCLRT